MSIDKKKSKKAQKIIGISVAAIGAVFVGMSILARKKKPSSVYENDKGQKNPFEGKKVVLVEDENDKENADGVKGHLEVVGDCEYNPSFYEKRIKRAIDIVLSLGGLVALSPVFAVIALAIKIEDPGPVLFTQKRVGQNKKYFKLHKFRSMKMNTPHDVPTHQLENPEQYITKVGKFLRAHSLDELPQIWDIFIGNMSVIGPRPGLWNQDLLTAERDKYDANDVKPGLTGWAQINGRDELEIEDKAKLDGEYVAKMGLGMDIKCFLGSLHVFGKDDSVVEGGTGERKKSVGGHYTDGKRDDELIGHIGFGELVEVDKDGHKKILVTGADSYIGESFRAYAEEHYSENFTIDAVDMIDPAWRDIDFSSYDVVYHVAGIAHADVGNVSDEVKEKYYAVNTDLAIEVAEKAKADGVKEFIFMSSMIVYGESAPYGVKKVVDEHTVPSPANFYGDSKLQADVGVRELADEQFKVIVLRPPMIYGKGSKGNYPTLAKLSKKLPVLPNVDNQRSMLYIENLCEFLCQIMLVKEVKENAVVFIPQNAEWTKTCEMVKMIATVTGRKVRTVKALSPVISIASKVPGKIGGLMNKAFGNNCYAHSISICPGVEYQKVGLEESIYRTEGNTREPSDPKEDHTQDRNHKRCTKSNPKHILVISQYFYPEAFRINDIATEWVKRGYKVTVLTGIPNYPMGKFFEGYGYTKKRRETWNGIEIIRIPLIPRGTSSIGMIANYGSFVISGFFKNMLDNIKADYVFTFEVSPMTQALIGCWYAKKHHVPHYLYVQDLWPENVITVTGIKNRAVIGTIDKMVDYIYTNTDEIFATSPSFVDAICSRGVKVDSNKVHYWPQYAEEFYKPMEEASVPEIPDDGSFKIAFTGNIGTAQGLGVLPRAGELLKEENVKFVIIGDGRYQAEFEKKIKERGIQSKFIMIPRQPADRIPELLGVCDAAFLSFKNDPLWSKTIPAKLQSYMACGMPVVASAEGETRRIIEEAECGICCEIGNVEKLAEAIRSLMKIDLTVMQRNSRSYYEKNFNKKKLMDQIDDYFK